MADNKSQIQEVQGTSRRINVKQTKQRSPIPRYTIFKLQKVKDREEKF